jgi:hypothetical protein
VIEETFSSLLNWTHTTGSNANQMATIYVEETALTNSQARTVDLSAVTNNFGDTVHFARVRFLAVSASSSNADAVEIGGSASAAFSAWLGDASDAIQVRPGGIATFVAPDATAYAVGTNVNLLVTNTGTNALTYTLYIGGSE